MIYPNQGSFRMGNRYHINIAQTAPSNGELGYIIQGLSGTPSFGYLDDLGRHECASDVIVRKTVRLGLQSVCPSICPVFPTLWCSRLVAWRTRRVSERCGGAWLGRFAASPRLGRRRPGRRRPFGPRCRPDEREKPALLSERPKTRPKTQVAFKSYLSEHHAFSALMPAPG